MSGYLLCGIDLSKMTKDMFCFLSSQSDSFLSHDLLSVCSHSNTTGATSRVVQQQSSPRFFCLSVICYRSLLVVCPFPFGHWIRRHHWDRDWEVINTMMMATVKRRCEVFNLTVMNSSMGATWGVIQQHVKFIFWKLESLRLP